MNDETRNSIQRALEKGDLYVAINAADEALRSRAEYDFLDRNERRFALLCMAVERSHNRLDPRAGLLTTLNLILKGIL